MTREIEAWGPAPLPETAAPKPPAPEEPRARNPKPEAQTRGGNTTQRSAQPRMGLGAALF